LEELFHDVFLRYPHVRSESTDEDIDVKDRKPTIITKKIEELSEVEREVLINEAKQFARELEDCVYDIYSEPDKQGNPHAGGKYKYVAPSLPKPLNVQLTFRPIVGIDSGCFSLTLAKLTVSLFINALLLEIYLLKRYPSCLPLI
jgi:hypothetical protein